MNKLLLQFFLWVFRVVLLQHLPAQPVAHLRESQSRRDIQDLFP